MKLSIITSLAPNEILAKGLLESLVDFGQKTEKYYQLEWLLASGDLNTLEKVLSEDEIKALPMTVKKILSGNSRAKCMNQAVKESSGEILWFLHGDSYFKSEVSQTFLRKSNFDKKIYYFRLGFTQGPKAMKINEWGVRFRCRFLKTPFGDQGLILLKQTFLDLGTYDEGAPYGEDHLLVRKARKSGVDILPMGGTLYTSARKYENKGWFKTTAKHQYMWYKQIIQQRSAKESK